MDYLKAVKDEEERLGDLINRWDKDKDLLYLKKYTMMDAGEKNKVPGIVNVTLNLPGRFFNDVVSTLGTAKEQSIVSTEDKNLDTTEIEDFRKAGFRAANARLRLQGRFELNPWWDFHSCIRGGCAARCLFQEVEGILIPDITQWDVRYVTYGIGQEGLDWSGYKTTRQKDVIEAEYEKELAHFRASILGKEAEVLDVWHTEGNEVWVDKKKVFEQPHIFGFCPAVIQFVVLGSMLADKDSLAHQGESIFFLIREAIPEMERLLSIMQTLNLRAVKWPSEYASKEGAQAEAPDPEEALALGAMTSVDIGGGIKPIDFGDAQRSAQLAYGIMREAIREATVAASDLGVIESPPASGVRAMVAGESRDQLLSPRLGLKALMNESLADMFTKQVIQIGGSVELGTSGHKRTFQTSKLKGQYEGYYKYTIKSAAVDAGRASLAAAYGDAIPKKAKLVEIYQREDPDGDERQLHIEEAERLSPAIKMYRVLEDLIKEDREYEAKLLAAELGVNLKQMLAGEMGMPQPVKEQEPKQVLSLFGGGGGRTPIPTAPEEE